MSSPFRKKHICRNANSWLIRPGLALEMHDSPWGWPCQVWGSSHIFQSPLPPMSSTSHKEELIFYERTFETSTARILLAYHSANNFG